MDKNSLFQVIEVEYFFLEKRYTLFNPKEKLTKDYVKGFLS